MPKSEGFYSIVENYRKLIKDMRNQIDVASEIGELVADFFVQRARGRLSKYGKLNAKNPEIIDGLLGNIRKRPSKTGWQIIIRQDREGLMTFLEYGTGLLNKKEKQPPYGNAKHPEASLVGWNYGGNFGISNAWKNVDGRDGWFFRTNDPNVYIDKNDSDRREGGTLVFTQGITPIRYIYDTRIEVEDLIKRANGDYVYLKKLLEKYKDSAL